MSGPDRNYVILELDNEEVRMDKPPKEENRLLKPGEDGMPEILYLIRLGFKGICEVRMAAYRLLLYFGSPNGFKRKGC